MSVSEAKVPPKHGLATFAPEAMDDADIQAFRDRLKGLEMRPITVTAMRRLEDSREVRALERRVDFAAALHCRYVITDSTEQENPAWHKAIAAVRSLADYASDRRETARVSRAHKRVYGSFRKIMEHNHDLT
jgi:sugar phosphate isomerase/epimerase